MGIGNTSTSTAVICALADKSIVDAVGTGTGMVDEEAYKNKVNIIQKGIEINKPDKDDPIDVVAKVGGLDLAALMGVYIGCSYYKVPVVIDGYISSAAFYLAYKLNPKVKDYVIESHRTEEPGYKIVCDETGIEPMFYMNMRLGEGSGCPFTFFAIDCACSMMNSMYTFDEGLCSSEYVDKVKELQF